MYERLWKSRKCADVANFVTEALYESLLEVFSPSEVVFQPKYKESNGEEKDSGSLVLELPLEEATFAAIQLDSKPELQILSVREGGSDKSRFRTSLDVLQSGSEALSYSEARLYFSDSSGWTGCSDQVAHSY